MTDTTRNDYEAFCKTQNPAYKPTDDSVSNRRDWAFWQAATLAERDRCLQVLESRSGTLPGTGAWVALTQAADEIRGHR